MCLNGGNITICDFCDRAVCAKCVRIPPGVDVGTLPFVCPTCHTQAWRKPTPYYVSLLSKLWGKWADRNPSKGFYHFLGEPMTGGRFNTSVLAPAIANPLEINGQFQTTSRSHVRNESLGIMHFILEGMEPRGSPPALIAEFMAAYLPKSSLHYEEISFNLADEASTESHTRNMRGLKNIFL